MGQTGPRGGGGGNGLGVRFALTRGASVAGAFFTSPRPYVLILFEGRADREMAEKSSIEWTNSTWNPITGCTKISPGCDFCYAERFSERFRGVKDHPFQDGFDLSLRPKRLRQPLSWSKPRMIFVNSMSDLFHKEIPTSFIDQVFETMEQADWHIYQILTKRSVLMRKYINKRYGDASAPEHIWIGVSVEDAKRSSRIRHLQQAAVSIRFLSVEPLIGEPGSLDLDGIGWVIVGGESGPKARPVEERWVKSVRDQCVEQGVPFFFKQWGGFRPKSNGRLLDGREWNEFPRVPYKFQETGSMLQESELMNYAR